MDYTLAVCFWIIKENQALKVIQFAVFWLHWTIFFVSKNKSTFWSNLLETGHAVCFMMNKKYSL